MNKIDKICKICNGKLFIKFIFNKKPKGETNFYINKINYYRETYQCSNCKHFYSFHNIESKEHSKSNPEAIKNQKIYSGKVMNILDATHKIFNGCILKKGDPDEIIRYWHRLPSVFPEMALPIKLFRRLKLRGIN